MVEGKVSGMSRFRLQFHSVKVAWRLFCSSNGPTQRDEHFLSHRSMCSSIQDVCADHWSARGH